MVSRARSGRPGPVLIAVPEDVLVAEVSGPLAVPAAEPDRPPPAPGPGRRPLGGRAGARARRRLFAADVVVAVGTRLSEIATFGYAVPAPGARLVHVDLEPGFSGD